MGLDRGLQALDRLQLNEVVRRALGSATIEVEDWNATRIHGGRGEGGGRVYRLAGLTRGATGAQPWSLVLKVLRAPAAGTAFVTKPNEGWDREVRTYRSGLLDDLPAGLAAPRCYAIGEPPGYVWLWLEDIGDAADPHWPIVQFARAARHLGRFNGRSMVERPIPSYPWLQRNLLRWRAESSVGFWADFERLRTTPQLRPLWSGELGNRARRLWEEREGFLDLLDRLPQVLVHGDADRRNLLVRPGRGDETVAIDWAFTGVAALGEELVNLVVASSLWFRAAVADLPELAASCLDGYVAGLRDAGWSGDRRLAQLGFAVAAALRYGPLLGAATARDGFAAELAEATGQSADAFIANWREALRFAFDQLAEVRDRVELA
jgi:hypothetical protein